MIARLFEKLAFSRRRTRTSSRSSRFLEEGRALRREVGIFSKMDARFVEKFAFSRRGSKSLHHFVIVSGLERRRLGLFPKIRRQIIELDPFAVLDPHPAFSQGERDRLDRSAQLLDLPGDAGFEVRAIAQ